MSLPQQKLREIVLQLLYSEDIAKPNQTDMQALIMQELAVTKKSVMIAQERVQAIYQHLSSIDSMISHVSHSYDFNRIHIVIKSILRLGVYELFFDDTIPPRVAISEAMRLARKFGTPESAAFVNAILDYLYQSSLGQASSEKDLNETAQTFLKTEEESIKAAEESLKNRVEEEREEENE